MELFNFLPQTFLGDILLSGKSRNNQYGYQPNFSRFPLDLGGKAKWTVINGQERDIYLTTAPLKIVINRLANMYANGRWEHLDRNGEPIPMEKSKILQRLAQPNIWQSKNEFMFQWFAQRCVYGRIYTYQLLPSKLLEAPLAMWNLPPSRTSVKRTGNIWTVTKIEDLIEGFSLINDDGKTDTQFTPSEIIMFTLPDCDDPLMTESPLVSIRMEISNSRAAMVFRNIILTKKGAIGAWSSAAKDVTGSVALTPDEEEKMIREMQSMYGIGDEQMSFMISSKELKWSPATYPTKEMMLFEEIDANKRAMIDLFGGNDNMFSRPASGKGDTFTNVEMGEKICYQDTMTPIGHDMASAFANRLGVTEKGESLRYAFDHLPVMQQDEKKRADTVLIKATAYQMLTQNGFNKEEASTATDLDEPKAAPPKPAAVPKPSLP